MEKIWCFISGSKEGEAMILAWLQSEAVKPRESASVDMPKVHSCDVLAQDELGTLLVI